MSRKTEFRGMRQNGEWLFGDLVHFEHFTCIFPDNANWLCVCQPDRRISPEYIIIPETIGQFTGFDNIFEGDTCEFPGFPFKYFVGFERGSFVLYHIDTKERWGLLSRAFDADIQMSFQTELAVTGNIHE